MDILIVDDNPFIREGLRRILEPANHAVMEAADGIEALTLLEQKKVDVIVSDILMPNMDGYRLCYEVRRSKKFNRIPFIICSGTYASLAVEKLATDKFGADKFVRKPILGKDLLDTIQHVVKSAKYRRSRLTRLTKDADPGTGYSDVLIRELEERNEQLMLQTEALKESETKFEGIFESIEDVFYRIDKHGTLEMISPSIERYGYRVQELIGSNLEGLCASAGDLEKLTQCLVNKTPLIDRELALKTKEGTPIIVSASARLLIDTMGTPTGMEGIFRDITERKLLETQLSQAQKLESIGQLAAGVAHEINTPIQYVGDNTRFLQDAFKGVEKLFDIYERLLAAAKNEGIPAELIAEMETALEELDIAYLRAEIPKAIEQSLEGVGRVSRIVRAMKEFSHPDTEEKTAIDINHAIENTILVARNEWKYVAEMKTDLDPKLPLVECLPGEFNQVILNLIVNGAHAISNVVGDGSRGKGIISISTRLNGDSVEIRISDTGTGIPESARHKIFTPFFTTKEVGKGTGQGLAIAHTVIVKKHGGAIRFETEIGKGTTFIISLPIHRNAGGAQ